MKTFAIILTAVVAVPLWAQRPGAGSVSGGTSFGPTTTIQPSGGAATVPSSPFTTIEATTPVTATPRGIGAFVPRGPGAPNSPPVVGSTFQRSVLGSDFPQTAVFDPAAAVPTSFLPAENAGEPEVIENYPVVLVPGTFPGTFEFVPAAQVLKNFAVVDNPFPNAPLVAPNFWNHRNPTAFSATGIAPPVSIQQPPVVFDFPVGSVLVSPSTGASEPVTVPSQTFVGADPTDRLTLSAAGVAPGFQTEAGVAPPIVQPGAPAAPPIESGVSGTGFRVVRAAQARLD